MSKMERIPDAQLQPAPPVETSHTHQTPLYIVTLKESHTNDPSIITLPGGRLMSGYRNAVRSIERDANDIARDKNILTTAHAQLTLPRDHPKASSTMGYSVRRANHTPLPDIADFVNHPNGYDEDHGFKLELHAYSTLLDRIAGQPGYELDVAYLRAFGGLAIKSIG